MRKFFAVGNLIALLLAGALAANAAAPTNFSGTWVLDKSKSELPPQLQNVESYALTVTQDAQQLTINTTITGGQGMGGPGGGGGGRAGGMMSSLTYKLDGTESTVEAGGGRPGSVTLKATWKNDGKTLSLMNVRKLNFQGNDVTITTTEQWELSSDGKTLTIHRTTESPRGTQTSTLVFNKK
jgi:hypothetical protein